MVYLDAVDLFERVYQLQYGERLAGAYVEIFERRFASSIYQPRYGCHVCFGKVYHVDIVTQCRAVGVS